MTTTLVAARSHPYVEPRHRVRPWDRYWPWLMAVVAGVAYLAIGWHLQHGLGVALDEALGMTGAAHRVVLSRDPHLGAMGAGVVPVPTLSQLPLVLLLAPIGQAAFAGPATSALWAAFTIPVLAAMGRTHRVRPPVNAALCAAYAASPIAVWVGANGTSDAGAFFFLAVALLGCSTWWRRREGRALVATAVGIAGLLLSRPGSAHAAVAIATLCLPPIARRHHAARIGRYALPLAALVPPAYIGWQWVDGAATSAGSLLPCWIVAIGGALVLAAEDAADLRPSPTRRAAIAAIAVALSVVQLVTFADRRAPDHAGVLFAPLIGRTPPSPPDERGWSAQLESWRALFVDADPMLRDGSRLLVDTRSAPYAPLLTHYPRRLVIPQDRDVDRILAAPDGHVDLVVVQTSRGPSTYRRDDDPAARVIGAQNPAGSWQAVGVYGPLALYRFQRR